MNDYNITVLVVDDDEVQHQVLKQMLEVIGVSNVLLANSGPEAISVLNKSDSVIDVLVLDLSMPGVDGMELVRLIAEAHASPAIIIVSAQAYPILLGVGELVRSHGLEFLGAVQKPATAIQLRAMLKKYQRGEPSASPSDLTSITREEIEFGLEHHYFIPFFQPKIDLGTMQVNGFEILARYAHPQHGIRPPAIFIEATESLKLMTKMTWSILSQAMQRLLSWGEVGQHLSLSFNASHSSLADTHYCAELFALAAKYNFPLNRLTIEVTENLAMTDTSRCLESLNRLRVNGVGLSIDDFGAANSSLQELSRVPYSEIKIDRSLINGAAHQPRLQAILKPTVEITRGLGVTSVAGGVETLQDFNYVKSIGCELAQGYYFAKPMPMNETLTWLKQWNEDYRRTIDSATKRKQIEAAEAIAELPASIAGKNILIVDSDKSSLMTMQRMLNNLGFDNIHRGVDSASALKLLASEAIDLLITDHNISGESGLEVLKKIRVGDSRATRLLPVILVTAASNGYELKAALQLDVNGFIVKPLNPEITLRTIMQALAEMDIELDSVDSYRAVPTCLDEMARISSEETKRPVPSNTGVIMSLALSELRPGMILLSDVLTSRGAILLSRDTTLNQRFINRLAQMKEQLTTTEVKVRVNRPPN
ncbi:EAL domain-containing protein [Spongiibacter sp. KMU-166]|uniref:EAL domain-containing protein n=1 Tax=Spongiibacter thalassae TaxID=2721624 RepID=A0ABX1GET0_9GAMM|nr:EAL domain-containing protein [Spongiibacter thalassae]NKI17661.1 EAL domain-containing protein [Spongiibacter thalassae]